jgi:hypothetical protein
MAVRHCHLHNWDADACAEFVSVGCGLKKYAMSFQLNIRSGKALLALNASRLCAVGVQSYQDQQLILEKIRQLAQIGGYQRNQGSHLSWRQQLSGALHGHKELAIVKRTLAPPLPAVKGQQQQQDVCFVKESFVEEGAVHVVFSGKQLPQVRKQLARLVPQMRAELSGRVEEEAWINTNAITQVHNLYSGVVKDTKNIIDENYTVSKSSMRNTHLDRDKALANRHQRGQVNMITVPVGTQGVDKLGAVPHT